MYSTLYLRGLLYLSVRFFKKNRVLRCRIKFNNFKVYKIVLGAFFCPCFIQFCIVLRFLTLLFILSGFVLYYL
jgi:hypothetical protein